MDLMKRLIKAEFYDGFMKSEDMVELYINPTDEEIEIVRKIDAYNEIRGVIYNDGTKIIWPADGAAHISINSKTEKPVNINQFRFLWAITNNEWIMDVDKTLTWDQTIAFIRQNKDFLSKIGDINANYFLMTKGKNQEWIYTDSDEQQVTARLIKKEQFFDGIMKNDEDMIEIYTNPTYKEFEACKKQNEYDAVRLTIAKNGTIYTWDGDTYHGFVKMSHPECSEGLHGLYMDNEFTIYPSSGDSLEDIINYFNTLKPLIEQQGLMASKLDILTSDYGGTKFPEYKDWNMVTNVYDYISNISKTASKKNLIKKQMI
jgi:hypothetical protein